MMAYESCIVASFLADVLLNSEKERRTLRPGDARNLRQRESSWRQQEPSEARVRENETKQSEACHRKKQPSENQAMLFKESQIDTSKNHARPGDKYGKSRQAQSW